MAIGFRKPEPPPPVPEGVIWALTKDHRRAHAAVRRLPHGDELRIYVDDELVISDLHRHGAVDALRAQVARYREDFTKLNWLPVRFLMRQRLR